MPTRALPLVVLALALLAAGFVLGRFTAPSNETVRDDLPHTEAPAADPERPSSGPLLHPAQRPPDVVPPKPVPEPPPPPPKETIDVEGAGEGARVHVKGGMFKIVKRGSQYHLVREGPWVTWHANGRKASEGIYVGGALNGPYTAWHDNGNVKVEATYAGGRYTGAYRSFHPDGGRHAEMEYRDSAADGWFRRWYPSGQLHQEWQFHKGKVNGLVRTWHANGQLASSGVHDMGRKDGLWTGWDERGTKRSEEPWRHGERDGPMRIWDESGEEVTPERGEQRASVKGKYSELLKTVAAPFDHARYGDFKDFGYYRSTNYAGVKDIPAGYWVYSYPNWYIWARTRGAKPK